MHRERRDVIRETWKSTHYHQPHYNVTVKFSLGTLGLNSTEVEELEAEEMEHHDLILVPHLKDTYTNLTRNVLYSLEWVDQRLEYSYLFKCDDDSFTLLDRIVHELICHLTKVSSVATSLAMPGLRLKEHGQKKIGLLVAPT